MTDLGIAARVRFVDPRTVVGQVPFPVLIWKREIELKPEMTGSGLISLMNGTGKVDVGQHAWHMLLDPEFPVSSKSRGVKLAFCEIGDLGFHKPVSTPDLWAKLKEINGLCSKDTGPQLRHQFLDQPLGDWAIVASEPMSMSLTSRGIFILGSTNGVGHNGRKLWIDGCAVGEKGSWSPKIKIIVACE